SRTGDYKLSLKWSVWKSGSFELSTRNSKENLKFLILIYFKRKMANCPCGSACNCSPNNCTCNHNVASMKENLEGNCGCNKCSCGDNCSCNPCNC
ncbi:hypothetical protein Csa_017930, partial [Cucumis sativus]